ncbi:MAG: insulinase family protein [Vicinamibacteria bacterium]
MRSTRQTSLAAALLAAAFVAPPARAVERPQIRVEELTLSNGMRFLLYEQHDSPTVAAGWTAHVGSVNERPGITGISHFFEHMMFKGTKTIGTRDAAKDLELIEKQERLRDEMRAEMEVMRGRLRRGEIEDLASPRAGPTATASSTSSSTRSSRSSGRSRSRTSSTRSTPRTAASS